MQLNENNIGRFNLISTFAILIIFAIIIGILSVNSRLDDFELFKTEVKNEFIENKKYDIKYKVRNINSFIINQNSSLRTSIEKTTKERVNNAYKITKKLYTKYKDTKTKAEMIDIIKEVLRPIRYDNDIGYIFMASLDGIELLFPVYPQLENTNVYNLQDKKGNFVIQEEIEIVKKHNEGFIEDYWTKPNAQDKTMIYPKVTFVKGFKELNLYIGSGMYIDDAKQKSKEYIKDLVAQLNQQNPKDYFVISELLDINGGDKFAKILVHPTATIGKIIGDSKQDINGKYYRKEYLQALKQNGETFLDYSFKHPQTQQEMSKVSYFILNKEWNWIIGTGFYDDLLDRKMLSWEENLKNVITNNTYVHILLLILFSIVLFFIIFFINQFTQNTIQEYKLRVDKHKEDLEILNNNLEIKIIEEVEKNQITQKQLFKSEKLASMGEMIGNIAHQWRQPLSVISTASTGIKLQKSINILSDESLIEQCDAINDNAQYLSKTIDDFTNFIKGDSIAIDYNLLETTNAFLKLVNPTIKQFNLNIVLDLQEDINLKGYPNELTQCLINIFNNAKDILIETTLENDRYIFISQKIIDNKVVITIKDNARGIPEDVLPKIFEPYFTTKHKSQGTGLGLHMTYNLIVDGMGGTIEVTNTTYTYNKKEYVGALFTITLLIN